MYKNQMLTNLSRTSTSTAILTEAGTALIANARRVRARIQNLSANPLFVKLGEGASTTVFTVILPAATGADNGTSAAYEFPGWQGPITIAGTTPRAIASEDLP